MPILDFFPAEEVISAAEGSNQSSSSAGPEASCACGVFGGAGRSWQALAAWVAVSGGKPPFAAEPVAKAEFADLELNSGDAVKYSGILAAGAGALRGYRDLAMALIPPGACEEAPSLPSWCRTT